MIRVQVLLNELANLRHRDGQMVRDVWGDELAVEVQYVRGAYRVYGFVLLLGGGE